jgi:hypothetical protein
VEGDRWGLQSAGGRDGGGRAGLNSAYVW